VQRLLFAIFPVLALVACAPQRPAYSGEDSVSEGQRINAGIQDSMRQILVEVDNVIQRTNASLPEKSSDGVAKSKITAECKFEAEKSASLASVNSYNIQQITMKHLNVYKMCLRAKGFPEADFK
jgi:hypothetical protein